MKLSLPIAGAILALMVAVPVGAQQERQPQKAAPRARTGQAKPRDQAAQPRSRPAPRTAPQRAPEQRQAQPKPPAQPRPPEQRQARPSAPEQRQAPPVRGNGRGRGTTGMRAVPRPNASPRARAYPEPRFYGYERPRVIVPVVPYVRPYYTFRPRFWIGFGLYVGIPVPYPVMWGYPSYVYGYPDGYSGGPLIENPAPGSYGGVSFDITPPDASVAVDGVYVGSAADFSPSRQPLTLTPGRHHIELQAPDMEPLAFDVDVTAGEVIPYRGALQPL